MEDKNTYFEDEVFITKNTKSTIKRFIKCMGKQKIRLVIVFISIIFYTFFIIVAPLYSANVVDIIWGAINNSITSKTAFKITWEMGGVQILILLSLYSASGLLYAIQTFLMASFAEKLNLQLRNEISSKLSNLPLSFYDKHQVGQIMSRATNDLEKMSEALQTGLLHLFISFGTIIGSIIMMFSFNVVLTLIFIIFMGISLILTKIVSNKTLNYATERQEYVAVMNGLIEEAYTGRTIIKAFNNESASAKRVSECAENLAKSTQRTDFIMNAINPAIRITNRFGQVIMAIFGGMMLLNGSLSPGKFQAFFQYANQAGEPLTEMSFMINSMQSALASVERVYELLDKDEITNDTVVNILPDKISGEITFDKVRFGYSLEKILLNNISFSANAGQKVAIVGSTGAGKTTLINLLMRFYEINNGSILLDGIDIKNFTREKLRENFGMVLQDAWLFEGTIAENISYGKPSATREQIIEAAKAARADFFIRTMPHGYDTVLNNDSETISIGQKQLLTIARVVLCNPSILILDEATSSVDTRTEIEIGKAMDGLMKNRTSFVIAHRLSTIIDADLILVMQDGNIIEQGNHFELLNSNGFYTELYNSQFA